MHLPTVVSVISSATALVFSLCIIEICAAHSRHEKFTKRQSAPPTPLNFGQSRDDFYVDGSSIPGVPFKVPDAYAGLLPAADDMSKGIYFYYQPAENDVADQSLTIIIQNGRSCSSFLQMLQTSGTWLLPFNSQDPVMNDYSYTQVSHMLYVDYPVGVGFSQSADGSMPSGSEEAAVDFYTFIYNFLEVFPELQTKQVYFAGLQAAARGIPYILVELYRNQIMNAPYQLNYQGFLFINPEITYNNWTTMVPSVDFAIDNQQLMDLNTSFVTHMVQEAAEFNVTNIVSANLVYPPNPNGLDTGTNTDQSFDPWDEIVDAAVAANPCFSVYNAAYKCPSFYDPLGYAPDALQVSDDNWINNTPGFKEAIHAPDIPWLQCVMAWNGNDDADAPPADTGDLGGVIDYGSNSIIVVGDLDYNVIGAGTLIFLQICFWGDPQVMGFQAPPDNPVIVNGQQVGGYETERKLTVIRLPNVGQLPYDDLPTYFAIFQYFLGQGSLS